MKINLAKSAGFCFGVKRAISMAKDIAKKEKSVVMLGDIVHNETVVRQIEESGIKKISRLNCGKDKTLLVRAHGASEDSLQKALKRGYRIVDATCPMVKEIHSIVKKNAQDGRFIIIIGDKSHDEVRGIVGQVDSPSLVIDSAEHLPLKKLKSLRRAAIVSQSTQKLDKVLKIVELVKKYVPDTLFFNTICRPTRVKQEEIKNMPGENDCMIIIGSRSSANTQRLYEISHALNKNTYWINSKEEIDPAWFKGIKSVGVTAGASTPDSTTQEIIEYIKTLK